MTTQSFSLVRSYNGHVVKNNFLPAIPLVLSGDVDILEVEAFRRIKINNETTMEKRKDLNKVYQTFTAGAARSVSF